METTSTPSWRLILQEELAKRCHRNARYSLRSFARDLGLNDGSLSLMLAGKRTPSLRTAKRLLMRLTLEPSAHQNFLASLCKPQRAKKATSTSPELNPNEVLLMDEVRFRIIADWYHLAIRELIGLPQFNGDTKSISKILGISETEAKLALDRLVQVGLIERRGSAFVSTKKHFTTADKSKSSAALRTHQRQILDKSVDSLMADPIERRVHSGMTLVTSAKKVELARQMIHRFSEELCALLEDGERNEVFQMCFSFFPLSKQEIQNTALGQEKKNEEVSA